MSRVEISQSVQRVENGVYVPEIGATAQINFRDTETKAVLYSTESGFETIGNPTTTDAVGRIECWVEEDSYDLVVTPADGSTPYTQRIEPTRARGGGLRLLDYAEITDIFSTTSAATDVPGLVVSATISGARPLLVELNGPSIRNAAGGSGSIITLTVLEGSTVIASYAGAGATEIPVARRRYISAPSAGTHTYKVRAGNLLGGAAWGTTRLFAEATNPCGLFLWEA